MSELQDAEVKMVNLSHTESRTISTSNAIFKKCVLDFMQQEKLVCQIAEV